MYTSGTTDHPKGVIHRYDNFYWKTMDQAVALQQSAQDRLLVVGPMYHVGGIDLPGIGVLWTGGTLVIHREFEPEAALAAIRDERITGAWFAPVMTNMILNHPARGEYDVSSLRWCIGGGERTPETRIREFGDLFTRARYIDAYGLTESFGGDTLMEAGMEIEKIGSTGRARSCMWNSTFAMTTAVPCRQTQMERFACAAPRSPKGIGATQRRPPGRSIRKTGSERATLAMLTPMASST